MPSRPRHIALTAALALGLAGSLPPAVAETLPVADAMLSTSITGTVTIVNTERRMLTIRTPDGHFEVLHIPEEVKRLDEIKIGNTLTIERTDFLLVDLQKGTDAGKPGLTTESAVVRDPGEKPSGTLLDTLILTGTVQSVDRAKSAVTVKGPENTLTLRVEDPALLEAIAPGDSVSATYMRLISGEVKF